MIEKVQHGLVHEEGRQKLSKLLQQNWAFRQLQNVAKMMRDMMLDSVGEAGIGICTNCCSGS